MKAADVDLAKLAQARGWISEERLNKSLAEADRYQALGLDKPVDEILVEQGSLTSEQVRNLRDALGLTLRHPKIGDYEILRRVGIGGMGTVFEACHVRLKQRIALKILLPRLSKDPQATERFLREARTLARLNHPHLVHAIAAGQDGDRYYLAMEYIEGENLLQVILREGPLPPERTCEIARDVCEALGALEAKGLVHRDVKPANILIGLDGVVKLADFGLLAPVEEAGGPVNGPVCGTPHYISPEQVSRKSDVDIRSDLYSLAASWYHLLTGRPPFTGKSTREIVQGHLQKEPVPPSRVRQGVPPVLDRLLLRWLSKDKISRPTSAREALAEIGEAEAAIRASSERKPWHRPRWIASGIAAAVLISFAVSYATKRERQEDDALRASKAARGAPDAVSAPAAAPEGNQQPREGLQGDITKREAAPAAPAPPNGEKRAAAGSFASREAVSASAAPAPAVRVERPLIEPLAAQGQKTLRRILESTAPRISEWTARIAGPRERFEPLRRLGATFHAGFIAIEPGRDPPAGALLRYDFSRASQIDDFRSKPGSWAVRGGALTSSPDAQGEPLDSVAWFVRPVKVSGELLGPGALIIGLGEFRVAPGRGEDSRIWREDDDAASAAVLSAPVMAAGPWAVTFREGSVEIIVSGRTLWAAEPPAAGGGASGRGARVYLNLAPGRSITRLEIEGSLEPTWARERARLAREIR